MIIYDCKKDKFCLDLLIQLQDLLKAKAKLLNIDINHIALVK